MNTNSKRKTIALIALLYTILLCLPACTSKEAASAPSVADVPAYSGSPTISINNNTPYFTDSDLTVVPQTHLSDLDSLGRCGITWGCLGQETMASGSRGSIGAIKPSGWQTARYDGVVEGNYLYNRCHLLMWKASSILDDKRNLITGTRYMNVQGMLPYEDDLVDFIESTGFHVMYRVTPVFDGNNLVASGVLMEAKSVEDFGKGLQYCVYAYNVQPGIVIDYRTGKSRLASDQSESPNGQDTQSTQGAQKYIINTGTKKFHYSDCASVQDTKPQNKKTVRKTREELIKEGYEPCGRCKP